MKVDPDIQITKKIENKDDHEIPQNNRHNIFAEVLLKPEETNLKDETQSIASTNDDNNDTSFQDDVNNISESDDNSVQQISEKIHKCVVCGEGFDKLELLLPHVKSKHSNFMNKKEQKVPKAKKEKKKSDEKVTRKFKKNKKDEKIEKNEENEKNGKSENSENNDKNEKSGEKVTRKSKKNKKSEKMEKNGKSENNDKMENNGENKNDYDGIDDEINNTEIDNSEIDTDGIDNAENDKDTKKNKKRKRPSSPQKEHLCNQCGKTYKHSHSLNRHLAYAHTASDHKYARICTICGEGFEKASYKYYDHYRRHFPEQCMKCSYCNKLYTNKKDFKIHVQSHTGEKPFKCALCDYSCGSKGSIKVFFILLKLNYSIIPIKFKITDSYEIS